MKIKCACGNIIPDQTDYLTYKARFVADQDYFDLREAIEQQIENLAADITGSPSDAPATEAATKQAIRNATDIIEKYLGRVIYQCPVCGRLFVDDARFDSQAFLPTDESVPKDLMHSIEGDQWKRPLRGQWSGSQHGGLGSLWWGFGSEAEGYERHSDWEGLKQRYFEVLAELQAGEILRDASLRRDNEYFHRWP